ncbi:MAG: hypothetical protein AB7O88_15335 [Reyranellaceae bacterium]
MPDNRKRRGLVVATLMTAFLTAAAGIVAGAGEVSAQGREQIVVFENCTVRPCMVGVAPASYRQPGWVAIGWYQNHAWAWRHACHLHHGARSHHSPDIAAGRVDCTRL